VVYSFCSQSSQQVQCTDGGYPEASLVDVDGSLYGTTYLGGSFGYGEVFAIDNP
jgi:uncharacterized repeat protein (TIGR03803 family)